MRKVRTLCAIILCATMLTSVCEVAAAKTLTPYVAEQKEIAQNTSRVLSSYSLYDNEIYVEFKDLEPNVKYKIFRKEGNKNWKVIKTFVAEAEISEDGSYSYEDENGICYNYDDYLEYTDKKVKSNTRYKYKLYSCDTGKYSKTETYWTAANHPKKVKQKGQKVTWKKVKGVKGYAVYYWKNYSFLDGYITDKKYFCKIVSAKSKSFTLPAKCKVGGVYSYTKHDGGYYLGWSGIHKTQGSMKAYIRDGLLYDVIKKKIRW